MTVLKTKVVAHLRNAGIPQNLISKLQVKNSKGLVKYAIENGLTT